MFEERAERLVKRIENARTRMELANHAEALESRAKQLEELAQSVNDALRIRALLHRGGVAVDSQPKTPGLRAFAARLREVAVRDPKALIGSSGEFGQQFKRPLEQFVNGLRVMMVRAWERHVYEHSCQVPSELDVFEKLEGFRQSVRRIRECTRQRDEVRHQLPRSLNDLEHANQTLQQLQEAVAALGDDGIPVPVREFLSLAGRSGAPLESASSDVLDWLREHGLIGQFIVTTR